MPTMKRALQRLSPVDLIRRMCVQSVSILLMTVLVGCGHARQVPQADVQTSRPIHLVVLMHGIYGAPSHFGYMRDALSAHLNTASATHFFDVQHFSYETLDASLSIRDFAKELDVFLSQHASEADGALDRISFVMHSQGGLVGLRWFLNARQGRPGFSADLVSRVDAMVTLGTPFWGAKMATFTRHLNPLLNTKHLQEIAPGDRQLTGMAFGSDDIFERRLDVLELANSTERIPFRMLNIAGYVTWLKPLAPVSAGAMEYEDDTAVPVPSAHMNFLYMREKGTQAASQRRTKGTATLARFEVVNAIHLSPVVESPQISRGIAQVQSNCIVDQKCDHPSFGLILNHLKGETGPTLSSHQKKMTAFMVDLNLHLKADRPVDYDQIKIRFSNMPTGITVASDIELYSSGRATVQHASAYRRFFFVGSMSGGKAEEAGDAQVQSQELTLVIEAEGYQPRTVRVPVRQATSTFLDLEMNPL